MDETIGPVKYNRANDIIFKLKRTGDVKDNRGLVDNRLFTGTNNLHGIMDTQTCLWHLKYEQGTIPPQLHTQFTSYKKMLAAVTSYFEKRNIEIVEILDGPPALSTN